MTSGVRNFAMTSTRVIDLKLGLRLGVTLTPADVIRPWVTFRSMHKHA